MESDCNERFPPHRPTSLTRLNKTRIRQRTNVECIKTVDRKCGRVCRPKVEKEKDCSFHLCTICNKIYTTKFYWLAHLKTHEEDCPNKCELCSTRFATKQNLQQHMMGHTNDRPYHCSKCPKRFSLKASLMHHQWLHQDYEWRPYVCCQCQHRCIKKSELIRHYLSHFGLVKLPCAVCGRTFNRKTNLLRHQNVHEETERQYYTCAICNKRYSHKKTLSQHLEMHAGGGLFYLCEVCQSTFPTKQHLLEHTKHEMCEVYCRKSTCHICSMSFKSYVDYKRHFLQQHIQVERKRFGCPLCKEIFVTHNDLSNHITYFHFNCKSMTARSTSIDIVQAAGDKKGVNVSLHKGAPASECMSAFSDTVKAENYDATGCIHVTPSESFQSAVDTFVYTLNENESQQPIMTAHSVCDVSHSFKHISPQDGRIEQLVKHRGAFFPCLECAQKFNTEVALMKHLQVHASKDLHACDGCDKKFSSKFVLLQHKHIHANDPLYHPCSDCDKVFTAMSYLLKHKLRCAGHSNIGNSVAKIHSQGSDIKKEFGGDFSRSFGGSSSSESFASMQFHCGSAGDRLLLHKEPVKETNSGNFVWLCILCRSLFFDRESLRVHSNLLVPSAKLWCVICGMGFGSQNEVKKCFYSHHSQVVFP